MLVACTVAALGVSGPAAATTPCGKKVLADWFDNGRVDRLYPPHCYEEAIDAIPKDLRDYADAEEVISRALQFALRDELAPGGRDPSADDPDRTPGAPSSDDPDSEAAPDVNASGPSNVPIPLLVLGGMSVALLAAGGLGYVSRRRHDTGPDEPPDDLL